MEIYILAIVLGLIPAVIADKKGKSFGTWWLYGALLWIVALPHSLLLQPDKQALERRKLGAGDMVKCPYCAELVKAEATLCRYCQSPLTPVEAAPKSEPFRPAGIRDARAKGWTLTKDGWVPPDGQ